MYFSSAHRLLAQLKHNDLKGKRKKINQDRNNILKEFCTVSRMMQPTENFWLGGQNWNKTTNSLGPSSGKTALIHTNHYISVEQN